MRRVPFPGFTSFCELLVRPEVGGISGLVEKLPQGHPGLSLGGLPGGVVLAWFVVPQGWHIFPHPVFYTLIAAVTAFVVVALVDRRRIVTVQ